MLDKRVMELITVLYGYAEWDRLTTEERKAGEWHVENTIHMTKKHGGLSRDEAIEYLLARKRARRAAHEVIPAA